MNANGRFITNSMINGRVAGVCDVRASVRAAPRLSPILPGMTFLSRVNLQHQDNCLTISAR